MRTRVKLFFFLVGGSNLPLDSPGQKILNRFDDEDGIIYLLLYSYCMLESVHLLEFWRRSDSRHSVGKK